jgi:hypothetical protein
MGYRQQAGADGAEPVSPPQVHGCGPQDGQHLDAVALLVEVGVSMDQRCRTKRSRASGLVRRVVRK